MHSTWNNALDIIEELDVPHPQGIIEAFPLEIFMQTIEENRESCSNKIKEIND